MRLTFYGSSDDNFCYDKDHKPYDEFGCYDRPCVVEVKSTATGEGLLVVGIYAPGKAPCWVVGVSPLDENVPIPAWVHSITAEGYTAKLHLDVPEAGIEIREVQS